jgi:RNA polymerase sigma-70 factor (ECF subfamily)
MSTVAYADDEAAYRRLVEPHRRELHAHCYRMLGSVQDAEDALQDALLRAWRGLDRFEGRSSPRSWLYRIATNTCLDAIAKRPKRILPIDNEQPVFEGVWLEPFPDELISDDGRAAPEARYEARESIELAFIAALQHLPANQRAVLILREVLGFSAKEVAGMLDTTPASVNSAMQRARASVDERLPERSQQETLRSLDDDQIRELVERYIDAWDRGDVDAVVAMLAEEATFSMPPNVEWFRGREVIREFLPRGPLSIPRRFVRTRANGQLAFGTYQLDDGEWRRTAIHVITLDASGAITDAIGFLDASLFPHFGLPPTPPDAEN